MDPKGAAGQAVAPWAEAFGGIPVTRTMIYVGLVVLVAGSVLYHYFKDKARSGVGGPIGGLSYVVGPMGSGKSMFGVREIAAALVAGKYVVTNVELLPGWEVKLQRWHLKTRNAEEATRRQRKLLSLYVFERELTTAMRYRLPCARCGAEWGGEGLTCGHSGPYQEGRAVVVWDETHNDLNNRDWDGAGDTKEDRQEDKRRKRLLIRWATQLRKLGYVGFLLSQHHENTDKQIQRACNFVIRLQNQRNSEGVWLARMLPRPLFLVYHYPAHLATDSGSLGRTNWTRRERYWLPRERHLYDSWATYHGIDDATSDETTPIPLPAGGRSLLALLPAEGPRLAGVEAG